MKSKLDPRHGARKLALSAIFCWLFSEPDPYDSLNLAEELLEEENIDTSLTSELVEGVKVHKSEIDDIIQKCAPEWPLDKISKIDLVILRIAIFEIAFSKKTPSSVAIDEAVELAKEFGGETSSKFVNGVLGTVVESLKE